MDIEDKIKQQENIRRFVEGNLMGDDLEQFKQALQNDVELEQEVAYYRNLEFVLSNERLFRVSNLIDNIGEESAARQTESSSSTSLKLFFKKTRNKWMLAGFLLLFFSGIFWLYQQRANGSEVEVMLQPYLQPFELLINTDEGTESNLKDGIAAYDRKEYATAAKLLEAYVSNHRSHIYARLYAGISRLLNKEPKAALVLLESLYQEDGIVRSAAGWYSSLAQLQIGEYELAKDQLLLLSNDPVFGENVQKLLASSKELWED